MRSRIQAPVGEKFALAVAVAAGERDDLFRTRATFGFEILERQPKFLVEPHQPAEPQRVLQRKRGALAGMGACCMCGIADQQRAPARPRRQGRDIERVGDYDVLGGVDDPEYRIVPAGVEIP